MKAAKFLLCCLAFITIFSFPAATKGGTVSAAADTYKYARADSKDVYFYTQKDEDYPLFTIPYTYCVEILSTDGNWHYVKYARNEGMYEALYGYCKSDSLTPVEIPPENIYLNLTVPLTFKTDAPIGSAGVSNELTVNAALYGIFYSGGVAYSYVRYDGKFYYIRGADDDYPLNDVSEPSPPEEEKPASSGGKVYIGIAIAGASALVLVILYFVSRKRYFRPDR